MAVVNGSRYCGTCGHRQIVDDIPETSYRFLQLKQVGLFFGLHLIICCLAEFVDYFDTLKWMAVFDIILATINISFVALNWSTVKHYLKWPDFSIQKLSLYVGIAMLISLFTHYTITWINETIFDKHVYYYYAFADLKYGKALMLLSMAVVPALSEELGFRAYLINGLLKIVDVKQAIIISSFLFSIIHLSFLSLYWLLPFSMFIAYIFLKEKTMWYGVCFHFAFNLTACLFEIIDVVPL
ncbi:CPBP family intramembrane metalloprotease [Mucilaginibacter sp. UR6-1]|uniref:CPBP family intramembrane glutamic endopeptidase n=1 Tax=Mucilaginibacter sp. UR6-1 TaxID=1435643 RepID=UPI001E56C6C7|nr:CPBP family intramembrane glutamic endopeptidase [Mucilaginibacter sp. UR6-1]MCC8407637.1 CPBP family intramembrane metalloprotease [Mucilaginibacter sp. UR6-1]